MLEILRFTQKYIKRHLLQIIFFSILSLLSWGSSIILPAITGKYIDLLININKETIYKYTKILITILILKTIISYFKNMTNIILKNNISFELSYDVLEYVKKVNIEYFHTIDSTYLNQRINMDCNIIIGFIIENILNFFINIITIIIVTTFIINLNLKVSLFLIFLVPLNIIVYLIFKNKIFTTSYKLKEAQNKFFSFINDQLYNIKLIKVNSWYDIVGKHLKEKFELLMKHILKYSKIKFLFNECNSSIIDAANLILFFFGGFEVINGNLTIGSFAIINSYFMILLKSTSYFLSLGESYQNMLVSYSRLKELLSLTQDFNGNYQITDITSITLKNLQFKYKDNNTIITNITYKFNRGNIYYVLGKNGSGKSTLIDLILGLYPNYSGEIYYNDLNIKKIDMEFVRKKIIGVTEQEPKLINSTLINNLTYGLFEYNKKDLENYCKYLHLYDFIMDLPDQFNFVIGTKSSKISGGEKQKISLIHNLLKNPDVLILDEPTSALDNNSVKQLKNMLQQLKFNKIIIIVTHDKELLDIANKVIELNIN